MSVSRARRFGLLASAVVVVAALVPAASAQQDDGRALTGPWRIRVCYSPAMRAKEPRLETMQNKLYDLRFGDQKPDGTVEAKVENFPGVLSMIANFQGEDLSVPKFFLGADADTATRSTGRGFLARDASGKFIGTWKTSRGSDGQWIVSREALPGCDSPEVTIVAPTPPRRGREVPLDELHRLVAAWWARQGTGPFEPAVSWGSAAQFFRVLDPPLKGIQLDREFLVERFRLGAGSDVSDGGLTIGPEEYEKHRKVGLTQYPVGWIILSSTSGDEAEKTAAHESMHMMYLGLGISPDVDGFDHLDEFTSAFANAVVQLKALKDNTLPDMMRQFVRAEFAWPDIEQRFAQSTTFRIDQLKPYTARTWARLIDDFMPRVGGRFDLDRIRPIAEQLLRDARPKAEADRGTLGVSVVLLGPQPAGATLSGTARVTLNAPAGTDPGRALTATLQIGSGAPLEQRLGVVSFAGGWHTIDLARFEAKVPSGTASTQVRVSVRFSAAPEAPASATSSLGVDGSATPGTGTVFTPSTKPFGRPQYLIHVTSRGGRTGTEKVDYYAIHADKPDAKGNFVAPDGFGGTRGYGSDGHSGPHANAAQVCAAAAGKVDVAVAISSFTSSADTVRCA